MQRRKWRNYFLQRYRPVEVGYLIWLAAHAACFALALFVPLALMLALLGRFAFTQLALFCALMAAMLAASHTYADHYALCPARTTDEAYRVVQSSLMIWMLFSIGALFFVSHYSSPILAFLLIWGGVYAAYWHVRAGRRALSPARDELLPASVSAEDSRAYFVHATIDAIVAPRKANFVREAAREGWTDDEIRVKAAAYFA